MDDLGHPKYIATTSEGLEKLLLQEAVSVRIASDSSEKCQCIYEPVRKQFRRIMRRTQLKRVQNKPEDHLQQREDDNLGMTIGEHG